MTTEQNETIRILRELQGSKCFCGAKKAMMQSFCRPHYSSLPPLMRSVLYQRFGEGYEGAYAKAREYFEQNQKEGK